MSVPFIHEDFLLETSASCRLFHDYAADEPILDYHCHLLPKDVAENRQFSNLFEIWLEGDHYKWRAMRAAGVDEQLCTGDADPYDKFLAWAKTVPQTLCNPLYHWTHLELKRYFGIDVLLNEQTAATVWAEANEQLASAELSAHGILKRFKVNVVGTTDDPTDDLTHHQAIAQSGLSTRVVPTFRPDKALNVHQPQAWNDWVNALEKATGDPISKLDDFLNALRKRHDFFHELGGRLSDHGLEKCYANFPSDSEAAAIFDQARSGTAATREEMNQFASYMMLAVGRWNAEKGWTMQLHLGARRNNNTRLFKSIGPDSGFDSIADTPQIAPLGQFLDRLDQENALPKTIVYNLNPADNYAFATMMGNFQDGSIPGKMQFGSGWWFLDQKEAMQWQIRALANLGLLSRFVGMLTDSRSFMSYPRHEYFRRVLCNLLGRDMQNGELPNDFTLVGGMVRSICYSNAKQFMGFSD